MVHIVETYPDEHKPVNPENPPICFSTNQKRTFNGYTKNWEITRNEIWKIKSDTPELHPHVNPEVGKQEKSDIRMEKKVHISIIPGQ